MVLGASVEELVPLSCQPRVIGNTEPPPAREGACLLLAQTELQEGVTEVRGGANSNNDNHRALTQFEK